MMPPKHHDKVTLPYLVLFCLYFVQGIPYGFQKDFLPIYLRVGGFSLTKLGLLRLVWFPWLLKSLWSPWIDKISTPDKWLTILLTLMACNAWICRTVSANSVHLLTTLLTLLNFLTSLQDIVIDGITVASLSHAQLGAGNIAQIVGYKLGSLCASVIMIRLGWHTFFIILAVIYFSCAMYSYFRLGTTLCKQSSRLAGSTSPIKNIHYPLSRKQLPKIATFIDSILQQFSLFKCTYKEVFTSIFQTEGAAWMLLFVTVYKLGEQAALSIFPLYLIDLGLSTEFVGVKIRILQEVFSVVGSLYGGWLAMYSNRSLARIMLDYVCLRMLPITLIALMPCFVNILSRNESVGIVSTLLACGLQLCSGIITSLTFTMMMQNAKKSPGHFYATHYSTLATAELAGKLFVMSLAGLIGDIVGYQIFFIFCFFACLLVIPLLLNYRSFLYPNSGKNTL
ncbi:Major facilitator superfamily domain-containing protein 3 [Trichoplax sp. H2]|nr:Major facilitator superfamily domain-containing protein 3 [Trichoplax sp. H2]|eukprot:RDD42919.1 Major facilitator superfamily domain-containing protein 3 [Trichoplax sp. H2]